MFVCIRDRCDVDSTVHVISTYPSAVGQTDPVQQHPKAMPVCKCHACAQMPFRFKGGRIVGRLSSTTHTCMPQGIKKISNR